jgi:hypothetical protein
MYNLIGNYMLCPHCSALIQDEGQSICLECGKVIDSEDIEKKTYPWVQVYTTNTFIDAEMFRQNLESAGIPAHILSQIDSTRHFTLGELAIVKIFVQEPYYNHALEIINEIEKS